jgi:hypothetical protein
MCLEFVYKFNCRLISWVVNNDLEWKKVDAVTGNYILEKKRFLRKFSQKKMVIFHHFNVIVGLGH